MDLLVCHIIKFEISLVIYTVFSIILIEFHPFVIFVVLAFIARARGVIRAPSTPDNPRTAIAFPAVVAIVWPIACRHGDHSDRITLQTA